ncbi:MAG: hypothetical protein HQL02_04730 [Nitrospirae bacterium]|nr:hypothetical protein [Nitrospirota bacterium]
MKILMILFGLLISQAIGVSAADSSFTQADRDRMTRLEVKLEEGLKAVNQRIDTINQRLDDNLKAINQRFDAINQRLDDYRGLMYVILSGMFVLVGFILWDRRTTLAPVVRTTREIEARTEKLEIVLKETAEKYPELKEALKQAGLL